MFRRDDLGDGSLIERHPIKGGVVPPGKGPLMIRAVAAHIAKGGVSREHEQESQSMGDKLALRFLGLRETTQYTLQQSHGPSFSVALDNTTLGDEDSCGYPSLKTVRSIDVRTGIFEDLNLTFHRRQIQFGDLRFKSFGRNPVNGSAAFLVQGLVVTHTGIEPIRHINCTVRA